MRVRLERRGRILVDAGGRMVFSALGAAWVWKFQQE